MLTGPVRFAVGLISGCKLDASAASDIRWGWKMKVGAGLQEHEDAAPLCWSERPKKKVWSQQTMRPMCF